MSEMLRIGQTLRAVTSGIDCQVVQPIGGGGQGEVYQALLDKKHVALKWYFSSTATKEQRIALELLMRKGAPDDRFLWPIDLVEVRNAVGFGYVMRLREPRFKGIVDLVKRRAEPSFRALTTAGYQVSDSFYQLHARGMCYRDISFGNVFFDPATGEVLICDNDNVAIDGQSQGGILGTPRFMAPEIVRGEAAPSTKTDLYSLAVLLFYMFMVSHPLEGRREASIRCLDLPAMNKLYGHEPLFVFDPTDTTNGPVKGYHDNALAFWPIYPQFLRDLFTRSFTDGLRDPENGRVRESEWRAAMIRARDSIVYCECGAEAFCESGQLNPTNRIPKRCWYCNKELRMPFFLRLNSNTVMLNHNTQLYLHHVDPLHTYDFSEPLAEVVRHPANPNAWGLRNLSQTNWTVVIADGTLREVAPAQSVTLAAGVRINFGAAEGEIRS